MTVTAFIEVLATMFVAGVLLGFAFGALLV